MKWLIATTASCSYPLCRRWVVWRWVKLWARKINNNVGGHRRTGFPLSFISLSQSYYDKQSKSCIYRWLKFRYRLRTFLAFLVIHFCSLWCARKHVINRLVKSLDYNRKICEIEKTYILNQAVILLLLTPVIICFINIIGNMKVYERSWTNLKDLSPFPLFVEWRW